MGLGCAMDAEGPSEGSGDAAKTDNRIGVVPSPFRSLVPGPKRDFVVTAQPIPIRRFPRFLDWGRIPACGHVVDPLKETTRIHPNRMRLFLRSLGTSPSGREMSEETRA